MKLPKMFISEKNLEGKTEQLLEEAKIIKEQTQDDAKERLLNTLMPYLDKEPLLRPIIFHEMVMEALEKESYSNLILKPKQKADYWAQRISTSETKIFFRKNIQTPYLLPKKTEYGLAVMKKESLEEFCKKMEKHVKERNKAIGSIFDHYNLINFIAGGLTTGLAYIFLTSQIIPKEIIDSPGKVISMIHSVLAVMSFYAGGKCLDSYIHEINKKKMIKLCSYYTEDEKEALRLALG